MTNRRLVALIAASVTLLAAAAQAQTSADSGVYQIAPQSHLDVYTGKSGLFSFAGHKHQIRARQFRGIVVYFPGDPSRSHLAITVATRSLEVLTPPDTEEIRKVTASMRDEVMHVDSFPEITFVSRQVTPIRSGFRVVGALTMHGQTRTVPVDFTVDSRADTLRARATFEVKQTDFGIRPFRGGPGGAIHVADEVKFDIDAVAVRTSN
jgi:polyisoprenoid-binding protein YceI